MAVHSPVIVLAACIFAVQPAWADNELWIGNPGVTATINWSDANNWSGTSQNPNNNTVFFGDGVAVTTYITNNIVDISTNCYALNYTNSSGYNVTFIAPGQTLTLVGNNGGPALIANTLSGQSSVTNTITGANGTLLITGSSAGGVTVLATNSSSTGLHPLLDLSGLGTFIITNADSSASINVANDTFRPGGTLNLAMTNYIVLLATGTGGSAAVVVGEATSNSGSTPGGVLNLGITNTIFAGNIGVGLSKQTAGTIQFNPAFTNNNNPTACICGPGGSAVTNWAIGDGITTGGGSIGSVGTVNFNGGTVNAVVNAMWLGKTSTASSGSPTAKGTLSLSAGSISVVNLTNGCAPTPGGGGGPGTATGTINVTGTGTLAVSNLVLAYLASGASNSTATLNVTNGTIQAGAISSGGGSSTINLVGGELILTNTAGTPSAPLTTLNLTSASLQIPLLVPGTPPLTNLVATTVNVSGVTTINIGSISNVSSTVQVPLLSYTGSDPYSGLSLGTLPSEYSAGLLDDTAHQTIDLILSAPTPASYSVTLDSVNNLLGNPFNAASAGNLIPNLAPLNSGGPPGDLDYFYILTWNGSNFATVAYYEDDFAPGNGFNSTNGWATDASGNTQVSPPILYPGCAFFLDNYGEGTNIVFGELPYTIAPPDCFSGPGVVSYVSLPGTNAGTFQSLTGLAPEQGAELLTWNGASFTTNTFLNGAWSGGTPAVNPAEGYGVFIPMTAPPAIANQFITNITATGASLNGSVNPDGSATECWFNWGTTTNYGNSLPHQNIGNGTTNVAVAGTLSSLSPNTIYHVQLVATNAFGMGVGPDQVFTTLAAPPSITNLFATNITTNGASLNGSVNPNGSPTVAWFNWGTTTNYGNSLPNQNIGNGTTNIAVVSALSSLSPGAVYHYQLEATNDAGTTLGPDEIFTTLPVLSYTVSLPAGVSLIANQLDHGSNTADILFPNVGQRDFDQLQYNYDCANGSLSTVTFDSGMPTGFGDAFDNFPVPAPVLAPGMGFFYVNNNASNSITFTGTPNVPVLPPFLACGYGSAYLLSRQTNDIGNYTNITGLAPLPGAQVATWKGTNFVTNTFLNGAWTLGTPGLAVGQAALIFIPSTNVESYTINLQAGFNLIANQLENGGNTLNAIMPTVPDGSVLYKYINASGTWSNATYSAASNSWSPTGLTLAPGEGAFFQAPTNFTLTFTGVPHVPVLPVTIPSGSCYLLSRQTNDVGNYTNIVGNPPSNGATVFAWSGSNYSTYSYGSGAWKPFAPVVAVGQAVWVSPTGGSPAPVASYTVNVQAGLNLIANQLDNGGNTLNQIMPYVPDGSVLYEYDNNSSNWTSAYYSAASNSWSPVNLTLDPGEGAFFQAPTNFTLTFTGTPNVPILPVIIPSGSTYLLSRQTNDIGNYTNIIGAPPVNGNSVIYQWNGSGYISDTYTAGAWSSGGSAGPAVAVGGAVWISNHGPLPPAISLPPIITAQPANLTVAQGQTATFTVTAVGTGPLGYTWQVNCQPDDPTYPQCQCSTCPNSASLTIVNVQLNQSGNSYLVIVTNSYGSITSAVATLTVTSTPPVLTCASNKIVQCAVCCAGTGPTIDSVLWNFGVGEDGEFPNATLMEGSDGALYGTTYLGGTNDVGTVFKLNKDGSGYQVLHNFGSTVSDGQYLYGALMEGSDGALYGTAYQGGSNGFGTVFRLNTNGSGYQSLYSFGSTASDGQNPPGALVQGGDGALYGTAYQGGSNGFGTVFRLNTNGSGYQSLYSFGGTLSDGQNPLGGVIQGRDGALYGTTYYGGSAGQGTVYRIGTNGLPYTVLYSFTSAGLDGQGPEGGLLQGGDGALYGTAYYGGSNGVGTVFKLATNGLPYTVLYNFGAYGDDGWNPGASLVFGCNGMLASTTESGGTNDVGTVFELNTDGSGYTVLHSFSTAGGDGQVPEGGLLAASDGALYTTTMFGGSNADGAMFGGAGTVFKLASAQAWSFDPPTVFEGCNGSNVTVVVLSTVTNGSCSQIITRDWVATDACGNSNTCSQTVTVAETQPPVIDCATNKTVSSGSAWSFDPPTATDPCTGSNVTVTVVSTVTNGTSPQVITRTWKATNACCSATCSQIVTVTGVTGPGPGVPNVSWNHSNVVISFLALTNTAYTVQYNNTLSLTSWNTLQTVMGNGSNATVVDPGPLPTSRFYRVLAP